MSLSVLNLVSSFFFSIFTWAWAFIFPVITLGLACIPIRLVLRHYS